MPESVNFGEKPMVMNLLRTTRDRFQSPPLFFVRLRAELRQFSCSHTFHLRDPGTIEIIHASSSFGPTGLLVLLWKSIVVAWILSAMIFGIKRQGLDGPRILYFAYLTNWGITVSLLYTICSFVNSVAATRGVLREPDEGSRPSRWICMTWMLFEIAAHTEITVTIVYWTLIHGPVDEIIYSNVMHHGIVGFIVLIDGLVVNKIPVRVSHLWQFVVWFDLLYMIFTVVYEYRLDVGNGPLYDTTRWKEDFAGTMLRDIFTLTIMCPLLYICLYALSLLSFQCTDGGSCSCSGRSRRYLPVSVPSKRGDDHAETAHAVSECNDKAEEYISLVTII